MIARLRRTLRSPFTRYLLLFSLLLPLTMTAFVSLVYQDAQQALLGEFRSALRDDISLLEAIYRDEGLNGLQAAIGRRTGLEDGRSVYLLVSPLGEKLAGNLPSWPAGIPARDEASVTFTDPAQGGTIVAEVFLLYGDYRLLVGRHAVYEKVGHHLMVYFLLLNGLLVISVTIVGVLFTRLIRRRMQAIVSTTRHIRAGQLDARIPDDQAGDEISALVGEINAMLEQQQKLLNYARQTSAAIAHDLRHPLVELRNRLEDAESSGSASREEIDAMLSQTDQLLGLFAALLRLGRLESGSQPLQRERIDLYALAEDAVSLYQPLVSDEGGELLLTGQSCEIEGDRELLFAALGNLLMNALRYGASPIRIDVAAGVIRVSDAGAGVPPELLARLAEPFFRVDSSRSEYGNGLGLTLVRAIAEAHQGRLEFANLHPGFRASLSLPL
ncbi:sensor histidine kinase [Chitinilyticum piscinae]|uniref:histidine kinase n=1 Tax=Chitinilyticum piscinae TaxID=2866724 RepID=A0A8J7FKZ4_9NEIS|nr:HAMP domain-containing sensor histidine kinase [Chitinilyticum piscinae]MBE9608101.1 HAMP domain-containing histidine kinase [Chitinilyticum piscinae]